MANNQHLKRHSAPVSWPIKRKNIAFIAKPNSGSHSEKYVIPVVVLVRDVLNIARTNKEVKILINDKQIKVNGRIVEDVKFPVGLFDVFELVGTSEKYTLLFDTFGKVKLVDTKDNLNYLKVKAKTILRGGKYQLNFSNGYNQVVEEKTFKTANVQDTVVFDFEKKSIVEVLNLKEKAQVYFFDGKYKGQFGEIVEFVLYNGLTRDIAKVDINGEIISTAKDYAYVIGSKKTDVKRFN